jgi:DNA polymerase III subunit gamma/tau
MSYLVLARKYRPQVFDEMVGQEHMTRTLVNSITKGKIPHAILLSGVRGIGKTTAARIFAKALNCEKGPSVTPCNECTNCREITSSSSMDVLEIDGASNTSVNDVRELKENVRYLPSKSKFKIYIIDEVHMLSESAFNALLKTLEEPPPSVLFIFATTEPEKIPQTILSRCQKFDLKPIPDAKIYERLSVICRNEKFEISEFALKIISREGRGSLRDALSILDKMVAYGGSKITDQEVIDILGLVERDLLFKTAKAMVSKDPTAAIAIIEELFSEGYDPKQYVSELLEYIRNLLVLKVDPSGKIAGVPAEELEGMLKLSSDCSYEELELFFDIIKNTLIEVSKSDWPRFIIEIAMIRASGARSLVRVDDAIKQINDLHESLTSKVAQKNPGADLKTAKPQNPGFNFESFLQSLKKKKPSMAALLENATMEIAGNSFKIMIPKGSFHAEMLMEKENVAFLNSFSSDFSGRPLNIEVVEGELGSAKATQPIHANHDRVTSMSEANPPKQASGEDLAVKKALNIFGGRLE